MIKEVTDELRKWHTVFVCLILNDEFKLMT